ncbi:MAG: hypothetical protein DLM73_06265 [Chthoniobacterales bacterium]|nr:MAG: hypothetical protein DLM73_06265 [Chthoniobacterales bacterium]
MQPGGLCDFRLDCDDRARYNFSMNKRTLVVGLLTIGVVLSATERFSGAQQTDLLNDYDTGLKYFRRGGELLIDHTKAYEHFRRAAEMKISGRVHTQSFSF